MKALIDGDMLVYRCGFAAQSSVWHIFLDGEYWGVFPNKTEAKEELAKGDFRELEVEYVEQVEAEPVENALHSMKLQLSSIINATNAHAYEIYLTGGMQWREEIYPEYKANRDPSHKPVHYEALRNYLQTVWNATVIHHLEADDMLAIRQTEAKEETCICSADKDLRMVPGKHYNFIKDKPFRVTPEEGIKWFYTQLLMGDTVDNIKGIPGIGPRKAEAILKANGGDSEKELYVTVRKEYLAKGLTEDDILLNGRLLWMRRHADDVWELPEV
jgi:DNA polymerase-1